MRLPDIPTWAKWAGLAIGAVVGGARMMALAADPTLAVWQQVASAVAAIGLAALTLLFSWFTILSLPRVVNWRQRRDQRRATRQAAAEQERCRAEHSAEITAWETFFEAAHSVIHYPIEVREERLPLDLAWSEFLRNLPTAERTAEALPEPHRKPALAHVRAIRQAAETEGKAVPAWPERGTVIDACYDFNEWMSKRRMRHFLPLYSRCGLREPFWTDRIKCLSAEELGSQAARDSDPLTVVPRLTELAGATDLPTSSYFHAGVGNPQFAVLAVKNDGDRNLDALVIEVQLDGKDCAGCGAWATEAGSEFTRPSPDGARLVVGAKRLLVLAVAYLDHRPPDHQRWYRVGLAGDMAHYFDSVAVMATSGTNIGPHPRFTVRFRGEAIDHTAAFRLGFEGAKPTITAAPASRSAIDQGERVTRIT